ncbi:MAG: endonuclease III [Verrucomicrobia bacterium]|nr:endonuclease III [Cytophagales bacterium]
MLTETIDEVIDNLRSRTWKAHLLLNELYGEQEIFSRRDSMRELISTMLSHRTTHADEERAYSQMMERFETWEGVRDAPVEELAQTLSPARFPEPKAANIKKVLTKIIEERGEANIEFLRDLTAEEGMKWLMELPGVGLKTATLVLLFNFQKPVLPVDTHVHRVTQRLGLISEKTTAEKAHAILLDFLPKQAQVLFNFHKHFFWHGQKVCKWAKPYCEKCPLTDLCDYYQSRITIL